MATPNYVLKEDYTWSQVGSDPITFKAGSFVRPILTKYVPKHCLEDSRWRGYSMEKFGFYYTRHGIMLLPHAIVRNERD